MCPNVERMGKGGEEEWGPPPSRSDCGGANGKVLGGNIGKNGKVAVVPHEDSEVGRFGDGL